MSALALQVGTVPVALGPYMITKIFTVWPIACPSAADVGFFILQLDRRSDAQISVSGIGCASGISEYRRINPVPAD